ncbi:hypothetical protein ASE21_14900 [Flavobacterium sp. Root901]|nr:hypothetical protein ASE21_14900 [Flavobacterium sp. Root901]
MNFNASYAFMKEISGKDYFLNFQSAYNIEKSTMYYPDEIYEDQIHNFNFSGAVFNVSVSTLFKGFIFPTLTFGYARKNNYADLDKIEITDFQFIENPSENNIIRGYGPVVNAHVGNYKKFDRYPLKMTVSFIPGEDKKNNNKLLPGGTLYYSADFGNTKPVHKLGLIAFLTKQNNETGIRSSLIGIGMQVKDFTNNLNSDNSVAKRTEINISASISLL